MISDDHYKLYCETILPIIPEMNLVIVTWPILNVGTPMLSMERLKIRFLYE